MSDSLLRKVSLHRQPYVFHVTSDELFLFSFQCYGVALRKKKIFKFSFQNWNCHRSCEYIFFTTNGLLHWRLDNVKLCLSCRCISSLLSATEYVLCCWRRFKGSPPHDIRAILRSRCAASAAVKNHATCCELDIFRIRSDQGPAFHCWHFFLNPFRKIRVQV